MEKQISVLNSNEVSVPEFRKSIMDFQERMVQLPGVRFDEDAGEYKHAFFDGGYVRTMIAPKDNIFITKIHKKKHPFFLLTGEVSILSEKGAVRIKAPYQGMTEVGTKRVVYAHEETTWVTVHATDKTDLADIEEEVIAKSFEECDEANANSFVQLLRSQTAIIIAAEKDGFWSDWTEEQQKLYVSGDWEAFSRSRGYTDEEIKDFKVWIRLMLEGFGRGINSIVVIGAQTVDAAIKNLEKDKQNEIEKSSHLPNEVADAYVEFLSKQGGR